MAASERSEKRRADGRGMIFGDVAQIQAQEVAAAGPYGLSNRIGVSAAIAGHGFLLHAVDPV